MTNLLPGAARVRIAGVDTALTRRRLNTLEHLLVVVPKTVRAPVWKTIPAAEALRRLERRKRRRDAIPSAATRLNNQKHTGISLCRIAADATAFAHLAAARRAVADILGSNPASLGVLVTGFDEGSERALLGSIAAAVLAATAPLPSQKRKPAAPPRLRRVEMYSGALPDLDRLQAENEGNQLARWLTSLPPNELDTASYRRRIEAMARHYGWSMKFLDIAALEKKGAGAFLAVARAGDRSAGIVHLQYRPGARRTAIDLALVGKGICFDTGGVNVKPAQYMRHMHDDMQGSAVALGVLAALTRLRSPLAVDCWLALSENLIGRNAYKPAEIVTAMDGTTIEIVHTDAEGRMVLADTLTMAAKGSPRAIIDYATLTGACVTALTERYSGGFTNRPQLYPVTVAAGAASGERVWPFPMDADFDEELTSGVADIRQCRIDGTGDHILAARFLSRFAGNVPWLHFDLAAGRHKGGLAHIPSDVTGFGVRMTLNLLREQDLLAHCR